MPPRLFAPFLVLSCLCDSSALRADPGSNSTETPPAWLVGDVILTVTGSGPLPAEVLVATTTASSEEWATVASAPHLSIDHDPDHEAAPVLDGVNAVFFVQDGWPGHEGQLALTYTHVAEGQILEADLALNAQHHLFTVETLNPTSAGPGPTRFDLQNLLTHELGHVLGLPHLEAEEASMFESINPGETKKRDLEAEDLEALHSLYAAETLEAGGCQQAVGPDVALLGFAPVLLLLIPPRRLRSRGSRR